MNLLSHNNDLRLVHYASTDALRIADALSKASGQACSWLDSAAKERFHLITAARAAMLIGFVAVDVTGGDIRVIDHWVSPQVQDRATVISELCEAGLDVADTAWGDVHLTNSSELLTHFLHDGWQPTGAASSTGRGKTLILSGAGVQ